MTELNVSSDLYDRYELLADELDGFETAADLARFVLDGAAAELERGDGAAGDGGRGADSAEDEVVEDRLEQLGYLEK